LVDREKALEHPPGDDLYPLGREENAMVKGETSMSIWSEEVQSETRHILYDMPPQVFALAERLGRKGVVVKHESGASGFITLQSCLDDHYLIQDHTTEVSVADFGSAGELLEAGWVVD